MTTIHTHFGNKDSGLDRSVIGIVAGQNYAVAYLNQTHSVQVITITDPQQDLTVEADAAVTRLRGLALAVKTADCAPVLLWDEQAGVIAAVHSGWQGTLDNIITPSVQAMIAQGADPKRIQGQIGPCLQQSNFAVGPDLYKQFIEATPAYEPFFKTSETESGKYLLDNTGLIQWQLAQCGVTQISADQTCTIAQSDHYYSYRSRHSDPAHDTMRNVSMIWMD